MIIGKHVGFGFIVYINEYHPSSFNSSPLSAAYMWQWTESTLVQVMACRLVGAKLLPEPMLLFSQLDPKEQTLVKFE